MAKYDVSRLVLKFPAKCGSCGRDLTDKIPSATEQGVDINKRPMVTDHCPYCGFGHIVAYIPESLRIKTKEEIRAEIAQSHNEVDGEVAKRFRDEADKRKAIQANPIEGEYPTPETPVPAVAPAEAAKYVETESVEDDETPAHVPATPEGHYYCMKCAGAHKEDSGVGKRHNKHKLE